MDGKLEYPKSDRTVSDLPFEDRRLFMRFAVEMPMRFFCSEAEMSGKGRMLDISANGMGFVTNRRLSVYSHMDVGVSISNSARPFYTTGEVVWVQRIDFDSYRIGVKLDKPELMGVWRVLNSMSAAVPRVENAPRANTMNRCFSLILKFLHIPR